MEVSMENERGTLDLGEVLPRPVGFVLGGGGSLGAVQVGMLQALTECRMTNAE
jgi:predicted acylesterase/phospholipase RssA